MSWFDRARAAAALAVALALGGCFQPLYGEAAHPGLVEKMREVEVAPIPDRIGHYLSNNLIAKMNGSGESAPAKYRLTIKLTQTAQEQDQPPRVALAIREQVATQALALLTRRRAEQQPHERRRSHAGVADDQVVVGLAREGGEDRLEAETAAEGGVIDVIANDRQEVDDAGPQLKEGSRKVREDRGEIL